MGTRLLQLARFCAVGLTCFVLGVAVLAGLHRLAGLNYLTAFAVSFVLCSIAGYWLNAWFTFSAGSIDHAGAVRYLLINAAFLCLNTAAMRLLVSQLRMWYLAAAVFLAVVNAPASFVAQRLITYRQAGRRRSTQS